MPYILQHTAEAIDDKLNLIDKNKNLLSYPYKTGLTNDALPLGFSDVGDGSILTSATAVNEFTILLNTFMLTVGKKYALSISITDIADTDATALVDTGCSLRVTTSEGITVETTAVDYLDLTGTGGDINGEISVTAHLIVPKDFNKGLIIKPQVEEVIDGRPVAIWVPNMDKIGTYVDRRFNGINARFAEVIQANSIKVGDVCLTDAQLEKILNFIECFEFTTK